MIFGKNRAFLYPAKVLSDTNNSKKSRVKVKLQDFGDIFITDERL